MKKNVFIILISFLFSNQTDYRLSSNEITDFLLGEYHYLSQDYYLANQYYSDLKDNINFESETIYYSIAEANLELGNFDIALNYFLKSYNLNKNNEDIIVLIYNLYIVLNDLDSAQSFLIDGCYNNKQNIYLLDILFHHFINTNKLIESIEVLSDISDLNILTFFELREKSEYLIQYFNDKNLIFNILDDYYSKYQNINFIKLNFIFSDLFNDFDNLEKSFIILKAQNKINIDQVTLYCQNLFTKKDFNTIFNLLKPYYANNNISFDGLKLFINSSYELNLLNQYLKYSEYAYNKYSDKPFSHEIFIIALIDNKNYDKALEIINSSLNKFPDYYNFYFLKAQIYEENNNYQESIFIYNQILNQNSSLIDAKHSIAKLYNKIDNYYQCDNIFLDLLDLNPNNIIFLNDFSLILSTRESSSIEELKYAKKLSEYALKLENDNAKSLGIHGWIYYRLGDSATALEYINKSYLKKILLIV